MTTVSIRCENADKEAAAQVAEFYGFDLSSVTRAFWKEMVRTHSIPLNFGQQPQYSPTDSVLNSSASSSKGDIIRSVSEVCGRYPQIKKGWVFGSVARNEIRPDSDIDIVLELDKSMKFSLFDLGHFAQEVEGLTGRECDVITSKKLRDENLQASVEAGKELVYEREK